LIDNTKRKLAEVVRRVDAPQGAGGRSLLLAEDDVITRQVLGRMFRRANYKVDFAEDGLEAVEMWAKGAYDLVLMDVQMPRSNGFEATRAIREKERELLCHTPIIAMTAHALKERCHGAGMDAYISKPIDFVKTLKVIDEILNQQSRCAHGQEKTGTTGSTSNG
jgi:CheY-like chemotaxis protein